MEDKDLITELQSEIAKLKAELDSLKAELEKAREREEGYESARSAMLFMLEDLNESRASIEKAKNEWEATFDAISDPIFIHDRQFKIVRTNKAYKEAAGIEFNEIVGRPYFEVFPKMERPFKMCLKASELQEEEEEEFSYPVTNRIFKVRFYPIKDIDKKLLYSIHIMEDITEAKKAEEKIKTEMEITSHLLMIADATAHTTDMDKLMQQVMHCGHEIMKCDVCLSYLWNEEDKVFQPSQCYGLSHEMIPIFRTEPLDEKTEFVKKAMEGKEPVIITEDARLRSLEDRRKNSTSQFPNFSASAFSWFPDINTIAVIPLIGKEDYLGIIVGIYRTPKQFTDRDKKVMQGISHQVSTALEQARLYKETVNKSMELSHKVETIQVMHEIDKSILSTLDAEEILETTVRLIGKVLLCERATVVLVDRERQGFIYKAGFGITFVQKGAFVPFKDSSAAEEVVNKGRTEYISDIGKLKGLRPMEEKFLKDGFLSHIRVPLVVRGEIDGILTIGAKRAAAFTPEDLSTLEKLASQISVALENARLVTDLNDLFIGTVRALSSAIDAKSKWTAGHSERVTKYALKIAKEMGIDDATLRDIELSGFLHDIGKIGTYEAILDKPGRLTDEELKIMRQHPARGAEILAPIRQLKNIIPGVKYHHEFYDGTGYPDGLKGDAIPLMARILAVADTVDAMAADRPYRKGRPLDAIIIEVRRCSGTQFDPKAAEAFLKAAAADSEFLNKKSLE